MYLDDLNVENDYSDPDDLFDTIPIDLVEKLSFEGKLEMIYQFKKYIDKEPEFIGIHNISSYDLYCIFVNTTKSKYFGKKSYYLTDYQVEIFKNLYEYLELEKNDITILNTVVNKIMKKIYVTSVT